MSENTDFGKLIRKARRNANMTQVQLADVLDVSFQLVGAWERNERKISIDKADELFKALGAEVVIGGKYKEEQA